MARRVFFSFHYQRDIWRVNQIRSIPNVTRGGPRNSDRLLRWDPDQGEGVWHATEATELSC